jgi:hypothetical protein
MNKPNFLIVGAQKSGTTSLYNYLKQHPQIYMSPAKEPHFFVSHFLKLPHRGIGDNVYRVIKDLKKYEALFSDVRNEKKIGEATATYLYYYEGAISRIKTMLGNVEIVIILRNPVDRAYSGYMHLIRDDREYLSFEDSLKEETPRIANNWCSLWHYTSTGFYYKQVKAYLNKFSRVKILLFDDMQEAPLRLLKDLYNFLDVDGSFIPNDLMVRYQVTGVPKYRLVYNILRKPNFLKSAIKPFISEEKRMNIRERIIRSFVAKRPEMNPETRRFLIGVFKEDVLALQDLINRDLTHWLK